MYSMHVRKDTQNVGIYYLAGTTTDFSGLCTGIMAALAEKHETANPKTASGKKKNQNIFRVFENSITVSAVEYFMLYYSLRMIKSWLFSGACCNGC